MKKSALLFSFLFFFVFLKAQDTTVFQTDVETFKKPWTGLDFYNDPRNFQFAIVSDLWGGYREGIFNDAVRKLNLLYPEFVLSVGDLISGKLYDTLKIKEEWAAFNQMADSLEMPFFYLPGNHDISNEVMAGEWEKLYGRRYYYFVYKNVLFLILDSNDDEDYLFSDRQVDYAVSVIKKHPEVRWTFVLMHHPAWEYDTDGRFIKIEQALADRKYTVIAGHRHHYHYTRKNNHNYYVLSTTGAGNRLRGNYFGEFDHITWITMTDEGPAMSNLRLDGILPHDIATDETYALANALGENTRFRHVLLTDDPDHFNAGTLYLYFENKGDKPIRIHAQFYHHHQVNIMKPLIEIVLQPGASEVVEIPLKSYSPLDYESVGALQIAWQMQVDAPEYPDFELKGNMNIPCRPSETDYLRPKIPAFTGALTVTSAMPFTALSRKVVFNGQKLNPVGLDGRFEITASGTVDLTLHNHLGQATAPEAHRYLKLNGMNKAVKIHQPKKGLRCSYYEGDWETVPGPEHMKPQKKCIVRDFSVQDHALRTEHFAQIYTGFLKVDEDEVYFFITEADDACQLYIDGSLIADQKPREKSQTGYVPLKKGFHRIEVRYLQLHGGSDLRIYFKKTYDGDYKRLNFDRLYYR